MAQVAVPTILVIQRTRSRANKPHLAKLRPLGAPCVLSGQVRSGQVRGFGTAVGPGRKRVDSKQSLRIKSARCTDSEPQGHPKLRHSESRVTFSGNTKGGFLNDNTQNFPKIEICIATVIHLWRVSVCLRRFRPSLVLMEIGRHRPSCIAAT